MDPHPAHPLSEPSAPVPLRARLVLLAGPSGSGKSHLADRFGVSTVCLDDFYRDGDEPSLPMSAIGIVDWDDPASWDAERALATLTTLLTTGTADLPVYDISQDRRVGSRELTLPPDERIVVAEGIFAARLIRACQDAGLLADAICLVHRPAVTFWRRLVRDLRENRKGLLTLLRRGRALLAAEPAIVAEQINLGAEAVHGSDALLRLQRVVREAGAAAAEQREPGEAAA